MSEWKPEDDRRNPDYLWPYLERLFPRVASKVRELTEGWGPRFHSGSVMGLTDLKHEVDSGPDAPVFDLYVTLTEFVGKGIGTSRPADKKAMASKLKRARMTDAEAVLGRDGRLQAARRHARFLLSTKPREGFEGARNIRDGADRCYELMMVLRDFVGTGCVHEFKPMDGGEEYGAERCVKCDLPRIRESA